MIIKLEKEWMNYPAGFEPLYISDAKGLELIDRGIAVDIHPEESDSKEIEDKGLDAPVKNKMVDSPKKKKRAGRPKKKK